MEEQKKVDNVCVSAKNGIRYHLGSLAMGSFVMALVWMIRFVLWLYTKWAEKYKASENGCVKCVLKSMNCCMVCFEKCVKFLSE